MLMHIFILHKQKQKSETQEFYHMHSIIELLSVTSSQRYKFGVYIKPALDLS